MALPVGLFEFISIPKDHTLLVQWMLLATLSSSLLVYRAMLLATPTTTPPPPLRRAPTTATWSQPITLAFVQSLPKVELHAHIGGSIRDSTLAELMANDTHHSRPEQLHVLQGDQRSLSECFQLFDAIHDLVNSLAVLKRITKECIADFAQENVLYLELRTTPRHDMPGNVTAEQYVDTVLDALVECQTEHPGIVVRLLLSLSRAHSIAQAMDTVRLAGRRSHHHHHLVVGLDFSGNPTQGDVRAFLPVFHYAREQYALPMTFHIGEIDDPEEVQVLLDATRPGDRLGHGLYLTSAQTQQLLARRICLEICPTSNVRTLELPSLKDHPTLGTWLCQAEEYPLCICTDDRGVFRTTLSHEYLHVAEAYALSRADLVRLARMAFHHAFANQASKAAVERRATALLQTVWGQERVREGGVAKVQEKVREQGEEGSKLSRQKTVSVAGHNRGVTVVGITGVSCAGKSTVTKALLHRMHQENQSREGLHQSKEGPHQSREGLHQPREGSHQPHQPHQPNHLTQGIHQQFRQFTVTVGHEILFVVHGIVLFLFSQRTRERSKNS